jgi:uncharacterized protein
MSEALQPGSATRMDPIDTPDSRFFWEAADQGRFVAERCGDCSRFRFPPRPMCPYCHSLRREVAQLSGLGKVISWLVPRHPPVFGFHEPPIVALIDLQEGIRFVANLVGLRLEEVELDLPVQVTFVDSKGGHKLPVFKRVAG